MKFHISIAFTTLALLFSTVLASEENASGLLRGSGGNNDAEGTGEQQRLLQEQEENHDAIITVEEEDNLNLNVDNEEEHDDRALIVKDEKVDPQEQHDDHKIEHNHRRLMSSDCVRFYEHPDYRGKYYEVCRDYRNRYSYRMEDMARFNRRWNDNISSIRVGRKVKLRVYEHDRYKGNHKDFTGDAHDLRKVWGRGRHNWNDCISGYKITNNELDFRDNCVRIYEHGGFTGKSYTMCGVGSRMDFASHFHEFENKITSMKVGKHVSVQVFEHANYHGVMGDFRNSVGDMGSVNMRRGISWNDQISSIKIANINHTPHCALDVWDSKGEYQGMNYKCKIHKKGTSCRLPSNNDPKGVVILPENLSYGKLTMKSHYCKCKITAVDMYAGAPPKEYWIQPYKQIQPEWGEGFYRKFKAECML